MILCLVQKNNFIGYMQCFKSKYFTSNTKKASATITRLFSTFNITFQFSNYYFNFLKKNNPINNKTIEIIITDTAISMLNELDVIKLS